MCKQCHTNEHMRLRKKKNASSGTQSVIDAARMSSGNIVVKNHVSLSQNNLGQLEGWDKMLEHFNAESSVMQKERDMIQARL